MKIYTLHAYHIILLLGEQGESVVSMSEEESIGNTTSENIGEGSEIIKNELLTSVASFNGLEDGLENETQAEDQTGEERESAGETVSEAEREAEEDIVSGDISVTGAAAGTTVVTIESGNDSEERNGNSKMTFEEFRNASEREKHQEHAPDEDSQNRNKDIEEETIDNEMKEDKVESQEEQESGDMGEERKLTGEDEIEQEILDDDEAVGALESPEEVRRLLGGSALENEEVGDEEEELPVFKDEGEDNAAVHTNLNEDKGADNETLEENDRGKMESVDKAGQAIGSRIALAMANVDSIIDNETENENIAEEDQNGNKSASSEKKADNEIEEMKTNLETEVEDMNGNISNKTFEHGTGINDSKPNIKDGTTIVDNGTLSKLTEVQTVKSSLESVKEEVEGNVDNLGKVSEPILAKTVTNGKPPNTMQANSQCCCVL